ncbi:MAG: methyltransferase [Gammaproteobacteria bacterium]|nr:methyltransferase [Gammaproteobacteria bacterium]
MPQNDELVFFSKWLQAPLSVASVTPSGTHLARAMVRALPPGDGLVVELGAGTGPITRALLDSGLDAGRLAVIERDAHFCAHLQRRFPDVRLVHGDALQLQALIRELASDMPVRAVISGLPLLTFSATLQYQLLEQTLALTQGLGPFIQFSYGLGSPLKSSVRASLGLSAQCAAQVWRNVPPAKVWVYAAQPGKVDGIADA